MARWTGARASRTSPRLPRPPLRSAASRPDRSVRLRQVALERLEHERALATLVIGEGLQELVRDLQQLLARACDQGGHEELSHRGAKVRVLGCESGDGLGMLVRPLGGLREIAA